LAAYFLGLRLLSQIHSLRAKNFFQQGYFGLALHALQKAAIYQPRDYEIHRQCGNVFHKLGKLNPTPKDAYDLAKNAKVHYQEAVRLNPIDAQSAFGLAREEDRLQFLYTKLNPAENANPHNALPYYERAIRLRPNRPQYHQALARYFYRHRNQDELLQVVRTLARIYPLIYNDLKKEDFWSPTVKAACRQGLQEAIKENILPAAAHMSLVDIATEEKDWTNAIANFQQALQIQPGSKTESSYFRLGCLFLKDKDMPAARASFLESLSLSRTREKRLESLYKAFKDGGAQHEFDDFYNEVQQYFTLSAQAHIIFARSLIDLKQYNRARQYIQELNQNEPIAEAYYWLAVIAEHQKQWDQMELDIQKATALEPENNHYRQIFFKLLKRMKKYESAERQLDLIIEYSDQPSASLHNEKAWLRWKQKDYDEAVKAWQSAIGLESDNAAYYAYAAEAYIMLGNWSRAVSYYQKATKLEPQNQRYLNRYRKILGSEAEG
jgi:tetratricopeptide (TPR) repeat protein